MTSGDLTQVQQVVNGGLTQSKGYVGSQNVGTAGGGPSATNQDIAVRSGTNAEGNPIAVVTGPNNQSHVSMSFRVSGFLLNELTGRSILSQGSNSTLSSRTYNYGFQNGTPPIAVNNVIDFPMVVENTGQLWVNRTGKIEYTDVATNPDNITGQDYNLNIGRSSCTGNGQLTVRNGGVLNIGEAPNNIANVHVLSGTQGDYNLQVFDALGKLIFSKNIHDAANGGTEGVTKVDVHTWQNGLYMVSLLDKATNQKTFGKVVVQH